MRVRDDAVQLFLLYKYASMLYVACAAFVLRTTRTSAIRIFLCGAPGDKNNVDDFSHNIIKSETAELLLPLFMVQVALVRSSI
jgi:hypothetical protein